MVTRFKFQFYFKRLIIWRFKFDKNADPDKFYDAPLHALEALPSSPNLKVPFS